MTGIWALAASPMLFTRNGRYYSLALALLLGSYLLYIIYVEKRNPLTLLGLAVLAIISYFTHPLIWISSFAALGLHFLLFHLRSLTRKDILWIGTAGALVAAVCLPVLLKHRTWDLAYETPTAWYLRRPLLLWFYIREIHNPYPTAVEGVTTYLKDKVSQDDVVYVVPEFESFPLMFYLGDQVKLGGLLSETIPIKAKVPGDPGYLYRERVAPDWIVLYGLHVDPATLVDYFGREQPGVPPASYKLETILIVFWRNTQKPEPAAHSFSPITDFDPKREGVIILKRTPAPTPPEKAEL